MGFGLLFLGYLTLLSFKILPVGIIGSILVLLGLSKLCCHSCDFVTPKRASMAFTVYFAAFTALWTVNIAGLLDGLSDSAKNIVWFADDVIYSALFIIFTYFLIKAMDKICLQVGYTKAQGKMRFCSAVLSVYTLGTLLRLASYFTQLGAILRMPLYFVEMILVFSVSAWIYSCYMMIATEEIIRDEKEKIRKYDALHARKKK